MLNRFFVIFSILFLFPSISHAEVTEAAVGDMFRLYYYWGTPSAQGYPLQSCVTTYSTATYATNGNYTTSGGVCTTFPYNAAAGDFTCTSSGWTGSTTNAGAGYSLIINGFGQAINSAPPYENFEIDLPTCNGCSTPPKECPGDVYAIEPDCATNFEGVCVYEACEYETQLIYQAGTCDGDDIVYCVENAGTVAMSGCCKDRKAAFKANECAPGEEVYDYVCMNEVLGDEGRCADQNCADERQDCYDSCDGQVSQHRCYDFNGEAIITEECLCLDGEPPDPLDDVPPEDDSQESDPNDLDNTLLQKITDNTANVSDNTALAARKLANIEKLAKATSVSTSKIAQYTSTVAKNISDLSAFLKGDYNYQSDADSLLNDLNTAATDTFTSMEESLDGSLLIESDQMSADIDSVINATPMPSTLLDGIFTPFSSLFPSSQECIPFEGNFPTLPEANFTIPCDFSDNFKLVFGWFLSVIVLLYLYFTITTRVVPND